MCYRELAPCCKMLILLIKFKSIAIFPPSGIIESDVGDDFRAQFSASSDFPLDFERDEGKCHWPCNGGINGSGVFQRWKKSPRFEFFFLSSRMTPSISPFQRISSKRRMNVKKVTTTSGEKSDLKLFNPSFWFDRREETRISSKSGKPPLFSSV